MRSLGPCVPSSVVKKTSMCCSTRSRASPRKKRKVVDAEAAQDRGQLSQTEYCFQCGSRAFDRRPDTKPLEMVPAYSSCLLFGRETHASTTQSDPLLLPARNGPCREDGALHWEDLFCRVQHPPS